MDARRGRRLAASLVLLCAVAIVLASFFPFQRIHDPALLARRYQLFLGSYDLIRHHANLFDYRLNHLCLNVLFYLPLGFLVALTLDHEPGRCCYILFMLPAAVGGIVLSFPIEYLQIGYINRDPDLGDAAMNSLGYLAGFMLVIWLNRRRGIDPARLAGAWAVGGRSGLARLAFLGYGLLLLMAALLTMGELHEISLALGLTVGRPKLFVNGLGRLQELLAPGNWIGLFAIGALFLPLGTFYRLGHHYWDPQRLVIGLLIAGFIATVFEICLVPLPGGSLDQVHILAAIGGMLAGGRLAGRFGRRWLT